MSPNNADGMAKNEDPDQTDDLGLHCLPRHIRPKTWDHYGIAFLYRPFPTDFSLSITCITQLMRKTTNRFIFTGRGFYCNF